MSLLADLLSTLFERRYRANAPVPALTDQRTAATLALDLVGARGEVSGMDAARAILKRFAGMDDDAKRDFFHHLAGEMDIDPATVRRTLDAYEAKPDRATYRAFATAAEPPRQELVRRLNRVPGATGALVDMRADLLRLGRGDAALEALDLDFRHLFASWFNRGFLVLRPINWESPAHILGKIIDYEAVHAIDDWDDLRRRLEPSDRRCFAFFHPAMPDEPLIFVEVALTKGVPGSVQTLLAEDRAPLEAGEADTAVFYSISNCQAGLAGISFGNSLIKQVVTDLASELPDLDTFVTLSPIPGLAAWMKDAGHVAEARDVDRMRGLAARYLLDAKRGDGQPRDPVARFHLGNGAFVHDVHALADTSPKGFAQSGGTMVNYLYDPEQVSRNHERYATAREVIAAPAMRVLADALPEHADA
jgi:malonyl-CoA decarboxylase